MHFPNSLCSALLLGYTAASLVPLDRRDTEQDPDLTSLDPMPSVSHPHAQRSARVVKRASDEYDLSMSDTWYWGATGDVMPMAKAVCSFERDGKQPWDGRIVALEKVMQNVTSVSCSNSSITVQWSNEDSFNKANASWDWVNQNDTRYLAMVVLSPNCSDGKRQTYKASYFNASSGNLSMVADAEPVELWDAMPFVDIQISTTGVSVGDATNTSMRLAKRFDTNIPVAKDFSGTNIFSQNISDGLDVALTCGNCKTTGNFDIDVNIGFDITKVATSSLGFTGTAKITANQVSATIGLDLVVSAELTAEFDKSVTFLNVPLIENPIAAAGVTIGPVLMVNLDAKIDSITASVDIGVGSITLSIPDGASATLDLTGADNSNSGFSVTFSTEGPSVNADISASASFGPNIILGLELSAAGKGAGAGLALAAPQLALTASAGTDSSCPSVEFEADLTAQLNGFAGVGSVADVAATNTISILATSTQIFSTCLTAPGDSTTAAATTTAAGPTMTPFGGTVGTTLNDSGCQQALNNPGAVAPSTCATSGGDADSVMTIEGFPESCCPSGTLPTDGTLDGTTSICCS